MKIPIQNNQLYWTQKYVTDKRFLIPMKLFCDLNEIDSIRQVQNVEKIIIHEILLQKIYKRFENHRYLLKKMKPDIKRKSTIPLKNTMIPFYPEKPIEKQKPIILAKELVTCFQIKEILSGNNPTTPHQFQDDALIMGMHYW